MPSPSASRAPFVRVLLGLCAAFAAASFQAAENPLAPPESPLRRLSGAIVDSKAPKRADGLDTEEALVRPELSFQRTRKPLQLATLARALASTEGERSATLSLLEQGTLAARTGLAAEGAENDLGAATAFAALELWQLARDRKVLERHADTLHAQVVAALAVAEVADMPNMAKQRHWEHCVGLTVFTLALREGAEDDAARSRVQSFAALAFEALFAVHPDAVDLGGRGLVTRKVSLRPGSGTVKAPTAGTPAPGSADVSLVYSAPDGFGREEASWATILRATSPDRLADGRPDPLSTAQHALSIFVVPPRALTKDAHTTFDAVWHEQFDAFELGDTVVHYRGRLKSGLVVNYMGNFFRRKGADQFEGGPRSYGVVHVIELGAGRVQPIVSIAVPSDPSLGMNTFKEGAARVALAWPLGALLDTVRLADGAAPPHPSGGVFQPSDLIGDWEVSHSAFGGFYVNSWTGASAGVAVLSSGGHFYLRPDGTYEYAFAYASSHPQFGNTSGSTKHSGRYRLDGDVPLVEPDQALSYELRRCAVGIGTRRLEDGLHRVLVLVGPDSAGRYITPHLVPEWDAYEGVLDWYVERQPLK